MKNMTILLLSVCIFSEAAVGQKIPRSTENVASSSSALSVFINSSGKPVLCAETKPQSCLQNPTIGKLHNDGAMSIFRSRADIDKFRIKHPTLLFDELTSGQVNYISSNKAFGLNARQAQLMLIQIKKAYVGAGILDRSGRFIKDVKPTSVIEFMLNRGDFSDEFARTLVKISDPKFGISATQELLKADKWSGRDKRVAIVTANIMKSASEMWPYDNGQSPPNEYPYGFWDAVGAVLLFETGPGSIIGGYIMSCAAEGHLV